MKLYLLLGILSFSSLALAKTPQEKFLISCKGGYILAKSKVASSSIDELNKDADFLCTSLLVQIEADPQLSEFRLPFYMGCHAAMGAVPSTKMDKKARHEEVEKLRIANCKDWQGR